MKNYKVKINGKTYNVQLEAVEEVKGNISQSKVIEKKETIINNDAMDINSPIQGTIIDVLVKEGQVVKKGDILVIIEAMKLENEVNAPNDGKIIEVCVNKGQNVTSNQLLVKMK